MSTHQTLSLDNGFELAYVHHAGSGPGVIFMGGFMSDMSGSKALAMEEYCVSKGIEYTRFDYQGHGVSSGKFEEGTIGMWHSDALAILDTITENPQIVVGSSMGGWMMLLTAIKRPEKVAGLVGIAAAPDFTEYLVWEQMTPEQQQELMEKGVIYTPSEYGDDPYPFTKALIEEGREHMLLNDPIAIDCPVHLIHGMRDEDVPWEISARITEAITSEDVEITLVKDGGHRMSTPEQLALLLRTLDQMREKLT